MQESYHFIAIGTRRALLGDPETLDEAVVTTEVGLLSGRGIVAENLRAVGLQLMADVLRPLAGWARKPSVLR